MLVSAISRRSLNHLVSRLSVLQTNQLANRRLVTLSSRCITPHPDSQNNLLTKCNGSRSIDVLIQKRFKKRKPPKAAQKEDSDDEEEDEDTEAEDDELAGLGYEDRMIDVNANRFDVIFKTGSHSTRTAVDQAFFENRIRVNGYCLTKKSEMASEGDVIDMVKGRNAENNNFLDVSRVEVLKVPDIGTNTGRLKMKIRFFRRLTIENYTEEPYEGAVIAMKEAEEKTKK